jgi:hypothetical protein
MSRQMLWFAGLYVSTVATLGIFAFAERAALKLILAVAHQLHGS